MKISNLYDFLNRGLEKFQDAKIKCVKTKRIIP